MKKTLVIVFSALLLSPLLAAAQTERSYYYEAIRASIQVNADSTLDVEETQTYRFAGEYHVGWRNIPYKDVGSVTRVAVIDAETGQPLQYSGKRLNKFDSNSWGKYTSFYEDGSQNIEWYFGAVDTTRSWILKYKVHGAIRFGSLQDRLYWNVFTDYQAPVRSASATVSLPGGAPAGQTSLAAYRTGGAMEIEKNYEPATGRFSFAAKDFAPGEDFTIDAGWPKGLVSKTAYWKDFFRLYYGYTIAAAAFLLANLIGILIWLKREKIPKGRRTIIAQYEPPLSLPPASAEVICKEKVTGRGLSATLVDLAARGYVNVEEEQKVNYLGVAAALIFIVILGFVGINDAWGFALGIFLAILWYGFLLRLKWRSLWRRTDYKIFQKKPRDGSLSDFERKYLDALLPNGGSFSTADLRRNRARQQTLYRAMQEVKKAVYSQTETKTRAYEVTPTQEKIKNYIWSGLAVAALIIAFYGFHGQSAVAVAAPAIFAIALWAYYKYEARLNAEGRILKEEWLGFKLYLQTAEKYRLQNLTPETFEKFLPYAMIFGVERQWAKNFESMHLPAPSWYFGPAVSAGGFGRGGGGGFSPSVFSASFATAFASSFSSSGAGGGGAGGGGAGGGGGGGGGGAG